MAVSQDEQVRRATTGGGHGFRPTGRISPYYEGVERAGGSGYVQHLMTYVPWRFPESPAEQYRAVTERVTLWDTACERQIQVRGPDAEALVDRMVTRDMRRLRPGRCCYAFVCDPDGLIVGDPVIMRLDAETFWLSISSTDLQLWAKGLAIGSGADVVVDETALPLQLQGPRSRDTLRKVMRDPVDALRFFDCVRTEVAGVEAIVSRTGWSAELGYEIYPFGSKPYPEGREQGMCLWDALLEAGEEFGILVTSFLHERAYEGGLCVFNHNQAEAITPWEFWRQGFVDLEGADFIGKAALERMLAEGGPTRKMVGLKAKEAGARIEPGEWDFPVLAGETTVGSSRRFAWSHALDRAIALATVGLEHAAPGSELTLCHPGGRMAMEVAALPFVDPEGKRVRG